MEALEERQTTDIVFLRYSSTTLSIQFTHSRHSIARTSWYNRFSSLAVDLLPRYWSFLTSCNRRISAGHRSCLDFHNEAYSSRHTFSYLVCLWYQSAIKFFWNLCLPHSKNSLSCPSLNNTWYCSRKPPTHRTWFLRTKAGREILVYGLWESLHHRNILEFPFRIIF